MTESHDEQSTSNEQILIGDIIRTEREKRNISLKVIASHTKISFTNLEALEANRFDILPNKAYVKGYVKSCAKLLGLNENQCLDILQANYDSLEKPIRVQEQKKQEQVKEAKENNELVLKMIGVIAVIVIIVVVMNNKQSTESENTFRDEVIEEEIVHETKVSVTPIVLSDSTPLKPEMTPTPAPTPTATPTPKPEEKDESEDKKEVELRSITGTLYGFASTVDAKDLDQWLPANFRAAVVEGKQNVFINAIDGDTWLTYQTDGGEVKKFILKQDQKLFITGDEVLLFLGNYKVTRIFLNNQLLEINSRSGVKSLVFPQEKANEHYYPLFIYKDDGSAVNSKTYKENLSTP
jgi:cytoskeleton protein RodZ